MIGFFRILAVVRFSAVAVFLVAVVFSAPANAQTFRGTILGTVTDSSGAAVSGATVSVKNTGTGLLRTVNTGDDGSYSAPELPIGTYSVTVEKSGFKVGVVSGYQRRSFHRAPRRRGAATRRCFSDCGGLGRHFAAGGIHFKHAWVASSNRRS